MISLYTTVASTLTRESVYVILKSITKFSYLFSSENATNQMIVSDKHIKKKHKVKAQVKANSEGIQLTQEYIVIKNMNRWSARSTNDH